MPRLLFTTAVLAAVAAWASAQPPTTGPIQSERWHLFQRNRDLLESLVGRAVELSAANDPLARAEVCGRTAGDLGLALRAAAGRQDADRVAELGEYLSAVIDLALVPTLADAGRDTPVGSPGWVRFRELHQSTTADAERTERAIPSDGRVGTSARVRAARQKLAEVHLKLAAVLPQT